MQEVLPIALGLYALKDTMGDDIDQVKRGLRAWAKDDPIDALFATVVGGGIAFYLAERGSNANCTTPWDGVLYMATALSVGYDNLFPTTPIGHALATFAQTFGPALANAALEPPASELRAAAEAAAIAAAAEADVQRQILARLDDLVRLLTPAPQ